MSVVFKQTQAVTELSGGSSAVITVGDSSFICPITSVLVLEAVDYNLVKAASGQFYLSTFADKPVIVRIKGIGLYTKTGCDYKPNDISDWYAEHKASANKLLLVVTISKGLSLVLTYKGYVLALLREISAGESRSAVPSGFVSYVLAFVGVKAV